MPSEFNPYQEWLGIADPAYPPNHYQLLGLADFEADPERIWSSVHDRRTVLQPQQYGTHAELANRLQAEVDMAETCLLNPGRKEKYDAELRTRQASRGPSETSPRPASSSKSADTESPTAAQDPPAAPPSAEGETQDAPNADAPHRPTASSYDDDVVMPPLAMGVMDPWKAEPPLKSSAQQDMMDDSEPPMRPEDVLPPATAPADFAAASPPPSVIPSGGVSESTQPPMAEIPEAVPLNPLQAPIAEIPPDQAAPADIPVEPSVANPVEPSIAKAWQGPTSIPPGNFAASPPAETDAAATEWAESVPAAIPLCSPVQDSGQAVSGGVPAAPQPAPLATVTPATPTAVVAGPRVTGRRRIKERDQTSSLLFSMGLTAVGVVVFGLLLLFLTSKGPFAPGPVAVRPSDVSPPPNDGPLNKPIKTVVVPVAPKDPIPEKTVLVDPLPPKDSPQKDLPKKPKDQPKQPPKADPKQMELVKAALMSTRHWLAHRDLAKAKQTLTAAKQNDPDKVLGKEIQRVVALTHYVEQFWLAVKEQCNGMAAGSTVTIQNITVGVVEIKPDYIVLRKSGKNVTYYYTTMKSGLAYGLAELYLTKNDPVTHMVLGAFLTVNPTSDRAKARAEWETAIRLGNDALKAEVRLLLPELKVKIPETLPGESGGGPSGDDDPKPGADGRFAPPQAERLAEIRMMIRAKNKARIDAAVFEADKAALADKLQNEAAAKGLNASHRFVLMEEARDLAAAGGDFELANQIIDDLEKTHVIDGLAMKIGVVVSAVKAAKTVEANKAIATTALEMADEAALLEKFSQALRLANLAREAARKSKDASLLKKAAASAKEIRDLKSSPE